MKSFLILALSLLSIQLFAGGPGDSTQNNELIDSVFDQVCSDKTLDELGVNGTADVTFTVDAEGNVHIQQIQSNDFLLEYHLVNVLESMKVSVNESIVGKTFSFIMNVVQAD